MLLAERTAAETVPWHELTPTKFYLLQDENATTGGTGKLYEVMVFDEDLSDTQLVQVQAYLAKKWNLTSTIDSDGDGFTDAAEIAAGTDPMDDGSSLLPDLSNVADAQTGSTTGLDSVEDSLVLWLDAANINAQDNAGLSNGDAISTWTDLSGNGNDYQETLRRIMRWCEQYGEF